MDWSFVTSLQEGIADILPTNVCNENIQSIYDGYQKVSENVAESCQKVSENIVDGCQKVSENVGEVCQTVTENVSESYQNVSENVMAGYNTVYENVESAFETITQAIVVQLSADEISDISDQFDRLRVESNTRKMTEEEAEAFLDIGVKEEAQKALQTSTPFWSGVEWFLDWIRDKFKNLIQNSLSELPIVGKWATRIGTSISEFVFTVFVTAVGFLKVALTAPKMWEKANEAALKIWNDNRHYGILVQSYGYGKKMASYFLEIIKQCLERAIKAQGLDVSSEEKSDISGMLDSIL